MRSCWRAQRSRTCAGVRPIRDAMRFTVPLEKTASRTQRAVRLELHVSGSTLVEQRPAVTEGTETHLVDNGRHGRAGRHLSELCDVEVGDPDGAGIAESVGLLHSRPRSRWSAAGPVDEVQVDVLDAKTSEATLCLLRGVGAGRLELGGDEHLLARYATAAKGFSDARFVAVGLRRVDVSIAELKRPQHGVEALSTVGHLPDVGVVGGWSGRAWCTTTRRLLLTTTHYLPPTTSNQHVRVQVSGTFRPSSGTSHVSPRPRRFARRPTFVTTASTTAPSAIRKGSGPDFASELEWSTPWTQVLEWKPPHAKWFVGGTLNASVNCVDRHVRDRATQQGGAHLGRRAGRSPDADVLRPVPPGQPVRQCAEVARREARRSRGDLSAADSRAGDRHAGVRTHRRGPLGRVWRLQLRVAARSHQRLAVHGAGHRRRRLAPRAGRAAEADGGRGAQGHAVDHARCDRAAPARIARAGARHGRARPLVSPADAGRARTRASRKRWTQRTCSTSSTRPAPPGSQRGSCTRPAAISSARTRRRSGCSISRKTTSTGARRTSVG